MITILENKYTIPLLSAVFLVMSFLLVQACNTDPAETSTESYVSGRIINPINEYIIFYKDGIPLDTAKIDENNLFSHKISDVKSGMYMFKHAAEYQNIYLIPGDSVLLRVNTIEFDESLHFSGRGGERNNLLAEMFLLDEQNSDLLLSYYRIDPSTFGTKTDSIKTQRLDLLQKRSSKYNFPQDFNDLAKRTINYEIYDLKERYTYLINKYYSEIAGEFPEDFFNYRDEVDFNEECLQSSPGYRRFIENHLANIVGEECVESGKNDPDCYNLNDHENIRKRIAIVDRRINIPSLRNHFLLKYGVLGIVMADNREQIYTILDLVQENELSEKNLNDLDQLGNIQMAYLPGTNINAVIGINSGGEEIAMGDAVDRSTIVFLWSLYGDNHIEDHRIINELREKYPEVDFIGVNVDVGEINNWRMALKENGYEEDKEYQLAETAINKNLFKYFLNKLLFLDPSGTVVMGDAYIDSPEAESRILEFLNRED